MRSLVLIADHRAIVSAVRLALRHTAGLQVVAILDGRATVRPRLAELAPDVVLVDEMTKRANALARVREAAEEAPAATVVLLAKALDQASTAEAMEAGAQAILSRRLHPSTLGTLLREVVHGNVVYAPRPVPGAPAELPWSLTSRELDVLRLVAEGRTNGRVAATLHVTEQTVKFHLSNIYRKLGVGNRTEATRHAHLYALVDHGPTARTSA
jgi:DNA-binding NarL/FixJ family response regulator